MTGDDYLLYKAAAFLCVCVYGACVWRVCVWRVCVARVWRARVPRGVARGACVQAWVRSCLWSCGTKVVDICTKTMVVETDPLGRPM